MSINVSSVEITRLLQQFPMAIPGAEQNVLPPGVYHLGIPLSIHSPSVPLFMVIDPVRTLATTLAVGDSVRLWVNGQATSVIKNIRPGEENDRIVMELPWGSLVNGGNTLFYRVTRPSGNFEDSTPILNVLFNNPASGITVSHPASIGPGQPATFTFTRSYPREYDVVTLDVGTWSKTIPYVHPANPITYTLTTADLQQIGDGTHPVSATVVDQLSNRTVSPTTSITISANQKIYNPPIIVEAEPGKILDVAALNGKDATIHGKTWTGIVVGQQVWLKLTGQNPNGSTVTLQIWNGGASQVNATWVSQGFWPKSLPGTFLSQLADGSSLLMEFWVSEDKSNNFASATKFADQVYAVKSQAAIVVAFLNGPYTVAAGGQVKDIQLSLAQAGQPIAGVIEVTLPLGTVYADGAGGTRGFPTRSDGTVTVSGVIAGDTPGAFSFNAGSGGATTNVAFTIKAYGPVGIVQVGVQPLGVTISADGTRLYVAKSTSSSVAVIDTTTSRVIQNIPVPGQKASWDIGVNKEGTRAYACDLDSSSANEQPFAIIDLERSVVIATLAAVKDTAGVVLSQSDGLAYVSSYREHYVTVIDIQSQVVVKRIPVGFNPWSLAITESHDRLYVCCVDGGSAGTNKSISIIDTKSLTVTASIPLIGTNVPYGLAVSPDGRYIYCCLWISTYNGEIRQIDTQSLAVVRTIPVNGTPRDIVLNRAGTLAYCCLAETNQLATIDLFRGAVIAYASIGSGSVSVTISHDDTRAYVASSHSDSVYVVSLETGLQSVSTEVTGVPTDDPQFGGGSVADSPLFR